MKQKTFCRICSAMCGLEVEVEDEQVLTVRGNADCPLTEGYSCFKGRAAGVVHHREDRLLHPKMRKDGGMQEVGWDEALDDLAGKLRRILDESGPDAIGMFLGGGCYLDSAGYATVQKMRKALGTQSFYSDLSIDVMSKFVVGEMVTGFTCMARPDFARCNMVIYVGTNPMVSGGHTTMLNNPSQRLREFMSGGEVWVLDPRRTETARKATCHVVSRPGTDYAILAHAVREVLIDGADWDYLKAHAQDVDKLTDAVAPFTRDYVSQLSSVPEETLGELVAAIRRNGRLAIESGTGISLSPSANLTAWMSFALMIVTGSLDREGGAWANPGFFLKMEEMGMQPAPEEGWRAPGPASRPELRVVAGQYICAAMPDEIESGNLRAMINLSGNLLTCMPDSERFNAALGKLEVLATIEIFDNAIANFSTHALPAKDQLERSDVSLAVDPGFSEIGAQFTPAVLRPRGDVKSYWWILTELGKRMEIDYFPGVDPRTMTDDDVVDLIAQGGRVPIDTSGDANYTFAQDRFFGWILKLADQMGGFRLAPRPLVEQMTTMEPPAPLMLIARRMPRHLNSRRFGDKGDNPTIYVSPDDAETHSLENGDFTRVRSRHGEITGRIIIDSTLSQGVLNVPHGWEGEYNVNRLTSVSELDPITGMATASNLPVELIKVTSAKPGHAVATA